MTFSPRRTLCTSCQAPIFFAKTPPPGNSTMPVDWEPVPDGNVVIRNGLAHVFRNNVIVQPEEVLYTSHFATCPRGKAHRRRG